MPNVSPGAIKIRIQIEQWQREAAEKRRSNTYFAGQKLNARRRYAAKTAAAAYVDAAVAGGTITDPDTLENMTNEANEMRADAIRIDVEVTKWTRALEDGESIVEMLDSAVEALQALVI